MVKALFDADKAALSDLLGKDERLSGHPTCYHSPLYSEDHHCTIRQYLHQQGIRDAPAVAEPAATILRTALGREEPLSHAAPEHPREASRYTAQCLCAGRAVRGVPLRQSSPLPSVTTQPIQLLASHPD